MEQSFYLTQSQGPGTYMGQQSIDGSKYRSAEKFTVPKVDRGLLTLNKNSKPGPQEYRYEDLYKKFTKKIQPRATMGTASRDIPFAKYGSHHNVLILKGLH